jgi:NADPH:quinone reductase-like Zn-dependent oxidoreductase
MGRKPAGISWEEAASLPMAAVTAMQGLRDDGDVVAGQKVLIIGASGGIGILAVQMAKAWGAEITGVCSTPNTDLVLAHGADRVIDYKREDFTRSDERFDLAFQLGGTESARAIRRVLVDGGTLVLCAGDGNRALGPVPNIVYSMILGRFVSQRIVLTNPEGYAHKFELIRQMIESGELRPVVDHAVDFEDAGFAIDEVETGSPRGKIAIRGVA